MDRHDAVLSMLQQHVDTSFGAKRRRYSPGVYASELHSGGGAIALAFAGYLVVKMLGPFVEAWATKLGEQFGESTARALGRIQLKPDRRLQVMMLGITAPRTPTTTLVLPAELSEAAQLAIIDLDPVDERVCGKTLHWFAEEGKWASQEDVEAEALGISSAEVLALPTVATEEGRGIVLHIASLGIVTGQAYMLCTDGKIYLVPDSLRMWADNARVTDELRQRQGKPPLFPCQFEFGVFNGKAFAEYISKKRRSSPR
ncbi:hypothetical protein [Kitasatospora sp. NPDC058046]|uniref:hypothetical protein n=1 Tax=Kitasatospora sp. NPDC058046 TaxID=3346312 RepID=UPI0036DA2DA3